MSANPTPQPTQLEPGFVLDRYELLAKVADGGFGTVWLARLKGKRGFEKLVAIKVPRTTGDVHFQEMLLDEARIASAIEHDNVCKIVELGEQEDVLYIVMEWIDGEPLSTLLRILDKTKVPFPLPLALRVAADLCSAAHAAHELRDANGQELGVVHRDISPQNVLLPGSGSVKLIDFGIAKARDRASGDTTDGTLKGKVKYMAPEQAFGSNVDRRTDVFALGAVLYRLIAGRAPYESENEIATLHKLGRGQKPEDLPDSVPTQVRDVVMKALELSPDARFRTALDMHDALTIAMSSAGQHATPSDLAAFAETHLKDRAAKRRAAIEASLKAASDRSSMSSVQFPAPLSSRDHSGAPSLVSNPPSSMSGSSQNSNSSNSNNSNSNNSGISAAATQSGISSSQSLGVQPAAMDISGELSVPPQIVPTQNMRWLWGAALGVGAIGIVLITTVFVRAKPNAHVTGSASAAVVATAPPPPPPAATSIPEPEPSASVSASAVPATAAATSSAPAKPVAAKPVFRPAATPKAKPKPSGTADFGY